MLGNARGGGKSKYLCAPQLFYPLWGQKIRSRGGGSNTPFTSPFLRACHIHTPTASSIQNIWDTQRDFSWCKRTFLEGFSPPFSAVLGRNLSILAAALPRPLRHSAPRGGLHQFAATALRHPGGAASASEPPRCQVWRLEVGLNLCDFITKLPCIDGIIFRWLF